MRLDAIEKEKLLKRAVLLLLVLLVLGLAGTLSACGAREIGSVSQLNSAGMKVGVDQGSAAEGAVRDLLPEAECVYYTDKFLGYEAVAQGKIDAFAFDRLQMDLAIRNGLSGVHLLDEVLGDPVSVAVGISPVSPVGDLERLINAFLAECRQDGTLDEMMARWLTEQEAQMPDIPLPENPAGILRVGTSGIVPPYSYYSNGELTGFDIELARRFAAWLGFGLELKVYDYGAIIAAADAGDIDCIMANLNITEERREAITFSDVLYQIETGIMVRGEKSSSSAGSTAYTSLEQLDGARIGVQTGTTAAAVTLEHLPEAQISYFTTFPDMAAALEAHKIDAFPGDGLVLRMMAAEDPALFILDEKMSSYDCGVVLPKTAEGYKLRAELNEFIASMKEDGKLDALVTKWVETPEEERTLPDYASLPAPNGVLKVTTEGTYPPMNYYRGEELVGIEVEFCALFCEAYGYGLDISSMGFDGMLAALQAGKFDFALSGIAFTEERAQSVLFTDPYYSGGYRMAVLREDEAGSGPALSGIAASLEKTFVREGRWRLFVRGVGNTILISLLSVLLGNLLGFLLFLLCRRGRRIANAVTGVCLWLIQGTPTVVLLMVLYYIVFGKVSVSGAAVAVFGFTLTFGAAVYGLLKSGIEAVDVGQREAAYALGYSEQRTFFRIVLPQALPVIMPSYRGELVSLLKATAVVGYIAVQDLTKMGDIVRSRTYEAFFPLIAVTVLYFCLEGLLHLLGTLLERAIDLRRRSPAAIRKRVKSDD